MFHPMWFQLFLTVLLTRLNEIVPYIPPFMFCAYSKDLGPKLQTAGFERKPAARFRACGSFQK